MTELSFEIFKNEVLLCHNDTSSVHQIDVCNEKGDFTLYFLGLKIKMMFRVVEPLKALLIRNHYQNVLTFILNS